MVGRNDFWTHRVGSQLGVHGAVRHFNRAKRGWCLLPKLAGEVAARNYHEVPNKYWCLASVIVEASLRPHHCHNRDQVNNSALSLTTHSAACGDANFEIVDVETESTRTVNVGRNWQHTYLRDTFWTTELSAWQVRTMNDEAISCDSDVTEAQKILSQTVLLSTTHRPYYFFCECVTSSQSLAITLIRFSCLSEILFHWQAIVTSSHNLGSCQHFR